MENLSAQDQYQLMKGWLNERQWRLYVASEAQRRGRGGISQVAREARVSRKTIRKGIGALAAGVGYAPGERQRRPGGGRKPATSQDTTRLTDLEGLLEPKGAPESLVQSTSKSMHQLKQALAQQGHVIGETAIRGLLKGLGFSRKANKKRLEGDAHWLETLNLRTSIVAGKRLSPPVSR